ncbi:cytoplasmic dynein 2 heavy chain 1 isoform X2 [Bicyclus anynana]|uniref:Cytoplasmic dynein 2 heavy chain 1 isoform X2 n=1 Tax=Bicyclus anynana TaxID=110368 RepID=A0ABM3LG82_BICAN|nr:cytoplasmic dynein 2 heavy chain 1 isoform X2 [Bicyclus anynana]
MSAIREFILSSTEKFYNLPTLVIEGNNEDILVDFLHNAQTLVLQTYIGVDHKITFITTIQGEPKKSIIFYKTSYQSLVGEDALNNINIITMSTGAAESLYQILRQIFSPLFNLGDDLFSNKVQKNLLDLETNLRVVAHGKGDENINVILSIEDEVEYWKTVNQKRDTNKKEREAASAFCVLFEDICEEIRSLQSSPINEGRDLVENIAGILDDVWRYTVHPYTQDRMIHIFDLLGHVICSVLQKAAIDIDIWTVHNGVRDNEIVVLLSEALEAIQTWSSACDSLTRTYWPNYALHAWKGKPYTPLFCNNFHARLKEIYNIRSTFNQLCKLLTNNEREELNTNQLFEPFKHINVWIYNGPNKIWDNAVARFSANLRPAESKIAEKLKPRLHNTSTKQMLYEFMRYKTLLNRPVVKQALSSELELFVSELLAMLHAVRAQLDADELDVQMCAPPDTSPLVQRIQWAKQMEAKVKEIKDCTENYLTEFEKSAEVLQLSVHILKDLKNMYTQLHEEWSRDLQAEVKQSTHLSETKPVVEFSSSDQLMVVNYDPQLVRAESEARILMSMGLPALNPNTTAALQALIAPLKHARALHQVASFHNTLGERMVPSTRPMMLQTALELSALVSEHQPLYWRDAEQLAVYTDQLKQMVLKLEGQNVYLTGQHIAIRNIVEKLMDTELLAKLTEWKRGIKDIRDIIEKVEANGYKNTEMWRSHWNLQLYKALECQYIKTLLSLHTHFPNVRVDLVLRGRAVRPSPSLEEIRMQHYTQLRRLVASPAHFVGVQTNISDDTSVFASIVDKHSWLGNKAVPQLEAALSALERTCAKWTQRAALGCVDLDALCAEHLKEPADWELNFKACKAYGQAVAKMMFEDEKIEWITVGTVTLRREFEAQARSLWTSLMASLQTSCRDDATALDSFMANATLMLENKAIPKNGKELAEISAKQQAVRVRIPEMEKMVEDLKRKGHLLRTWGGDSSLDSTFREWHKLHEQMLSQQQMFEHQAEIVKSSLTGEWKNLQSGMEAWVSRWTQAKARLEDTRDATYEQIADRCRSVLDAVEHCDKLITEKQELMIECEKFNIQLESSETWMEAESLKTEYVNLWTTFKDYDDEYKALGEQEWAVFQKKLHLLDDFIMRWTAQLEPFTSVTLYIKQELDKYSDLTPSLKYLRGTDFTEKHWREVFSLVALEYVKPETLQLKHLLSVSLNIKKNIKALQKISSSASSEASVRSALNELELWYASARFAVIYYTDKSKRLTPIVKDFKDLLAKVEEQQWVVSSLGMECTSCATWDARLQAAKRLVRSAHHAQRRWLYLEPILSNDEGDLGTKFRKVDQGFKQVTRVIESDPRLSALVQSPRLQPMLDAISEQLNACQSALNDYIDEKRSIFPRLYFLSDDDLLELLGQARAGAEGREAVMQNHLKKLFPGITGVRLGPGGLCITALSSHYGEMFQLDHPVDIDCSVEVWLKNLEQEIRTSLRNMTLKCLVANSLQDQDPFSLPTQILCLAQNIRFTEQTERAITSKELHKLKDNLENETTYYASTEVEDESEKYKKQALILQSAYYRTVVQTLIENNVTTTNDWLWQKQLRFYLLSSKEVVAKMGLAQISYSYEYLGVNNGQFVRTETTDESFLILTQSLHLGLVGNPFGPAGTGKTESVKALGGLVGRLVLVFNCDEAMDAQCMGRLLSGVAQCGAWGCFDEFNRLSADTLAAVSHQFASLLAATHKRTPTVEPTALLNGKQVVVSAWCGVAATMNPTGRGYGGRRALPAALQHALRPLALRAPPRRDLAARLLAAHAAHQPQTLAADLDTVFTLASTLLSGQSHYDWGLRALKAAVGSCGAALSANAAASHEQQRALLRKVLRLNNLSKLTQYDAERFENILSMVFAGVPEEQTGVDPIYSFLDATVKHLGLIHNKQQIQKCMELFEQLQQRMGVVIVGPPGSGKSTIRQMLKTALTLQGKTIVEHVIYPKAMSRSWLLGHIELDTRQWTDGVMSTVALQAANQPDDVWSWVVCDGDIEPEWVEALNSVLDDNRLLTLPSGWRVQFARNVNFLFETHSLEHASPATISRMGIILLSDESHCAEEILENWIQKTEFDNESAKLSMPLLNQTVKKCIQWLDKHKSDVVVKHCCMSLVRQILTQFEYIAQDINATTVHINPDEMVWLAVQRSIAGLLKSSAVDSFYDHLEMSPLMVVEAPGACSEWADALYRSARVRACEPAVRAALHARTHAVVIGPDACAKNTLAEYILGESNSTMIIIDCTPILEPVDIIAELKRKNVVHSGGRATTGSTSRATLLVRSLHRAYRDSWGSSLVHSFLLQLIQQNGFWAREEGGPQWYSTGRIAIVATATSHAMLTPRLAATLVPIVLTEPDEKELLELSRYYLAESVGNNISDNEMSELARHMFSLYKEVTETFHSRSHYVWNPSHLKTWCGNIKWYSTSNMQELLIAIKSEANMIFRERLVTDDEKSQFNTIVRSYIKLDDSELFFKAKVRGDGVHLESVDYKEWYQNIQKVINQCLTDDERVFGDTGMEACIELSALCSAISLALNGGVVTCVGTSGVGRGPAATIACATLGSNLYVVDQHNQFHNLFKNALISASEGSRTLLVLREPVATADVLSFVEAFLKAKSIHVLPSSIVASLGQHTQQSLSDIKQNLGLMICLDIDQENLNQLLNCHPLLLRAGTLCWLQRWSADTLRQMPARVLQRLVKENAQEMTKEDVDSIPVEGFVNIYGSLDAEWVRSPSRYMHFIRTYYHIFSNKKQALLQRQATLSAGVEALRRARSEVATLQKEAAAQEVALSDKQAKANQALDQIGATVRATTDKKEEMHQLKKNIELENEKLQIRKKEIETELASVEPVIAAARAAVGDIRPESLSEVRSLRAPPDVVRDVLEGVLRLMGIADTSWHSMKSFLSKRGVKEDIRCLDASQISSEAALSVEKLLEKRGASFEQATAKRASAACAPLAAWVRANLAYARALARVQPLQEQQRQLHKNLHQAEAELAALSSGLATVDERVAALKEQLGLHTREAAALELRLSTAVGTIQAARDLLDQLAHEYESWESDLQNISREILELNQRSLLAAAYLVYLSDLTEPQSRKYLAKWGTLINFEDSSFSVINFLSSAENQLKWEADGLSQDQSAIKNAVYIDQYLQSRSCGLIPLIVDPEREAEVWLAHTLAGTPCDFVPQHSDKLYTALQYAVRLNRVIVITELESIEEWWWSALSSGRARALLVTRDARVTRAAPHALARLAPLHFAARLHALVDQLVHYAMQKQNPEMNEKSKEIKLTRATLQKQQHELQENLLKDLSSNSDILHDANLLASLKKTRTTSATISEALASAKALEVETAAACEAYEASALCAAQLALAVKQMGVHRPLVTLPMDTVLDVFVGAVRRSANAGDPKNINSVDVTKFFTRRIIERVLLSLHKKDKYICVMHLLRHVYDNLVPEKVQDEGLFGRLSLDKSDIWLEFLKSGDLLTIGRLNLSLFENIVAVAAMRPDSLYRAITAFVDDILGAGGMSGGESVARAVRWATPARPALLLAAHAPDVLVAHASANSHALTTVGIEDGVNVWEASLEASRGGAWLAIVVGASPFTRDLLAFVTSLTERPTTDFSDGFRLWILAEDREIPSTLTNMCVNVVLEAAEGVKRNVCGTLSAWGRRAGDAGMLRHLARLALFHALVQERRAYIPQGWSRWYAWEWGDVSASAACAGAGADAARELCGALYAARVDGRRDRELLQALLRRCMLDAANTLPAPLPLATNMQDYIAAHEALPDMDSPQLLELPANCRVAWEKNAADNIVAGLRELSTTTATKQSDAATPLKTLLVLWKKLMSGCPLIKADYHIEKLCGGWWGAVCAAELRDAAHAARALHAALARFAHAPAHAAPLLHKVPDAWQLLWAGPDAPEVYLREFSARARAAVQRSCDLKSNDDYFPTEVDVRTFVRPQRVLSALRARSAAQRACAAHALALAAKWDCTESVTDGVVLRGLVLSGGAWAEGALRAASPAAPPHAPAPPLLLRYIAQDTTSSPYGEHAFEVPLYTSAARDEELARARAPLHATLAPRTALLHALALVVAPCD